MEPHEVVLALGGAATRSQLLAHCSRPELESALNAGRLVRVARGRYALRETRDAARAVAARVSGTVAGPSAAQLHGWGVAVPPDLPWVSVPRNRKLTPEQRTWAHVIRSDARGDLSPPLQTVLDCSRRLPLPEALAVADSALRSGGVDPEELRAAAAAVRGPGAERCRRVSTLATPLAGSALESALRGTVADVPGLDVLPQVAIELAGFTAHPDLVDPRLRIVLEADTWRFHGADPVAFNRDMRRYTLLTAAGWTVLRFGRHEVIDEPDFVVDAVTAVMGAAALRLRRSPLL